MGGRFEINQAEVNRLLHSRTGPVGAHVEKFGRSTARIAKRIAPRDKGNLAASIKVEPSFSPSGLSLIVSASDHAALVIHQGHGVIRPVRAPALRFQPKDLRGSKGIVITQRVRAVGGYPFLTHAMVEANNALPTDVRFRIVIRVQPRRGVQPSGLPRLPYPQ